MKKNIRKHMINLRKSLNSEEKKELDKQIVTLIRADKRYQQAKTVALFYPMSFEIDLRDLLKDNKVFLFPKVNGLDMTFYPYNDEMRFIKSAFGVYEPEEGTPYIDTIDYMIVPALAIDQNNHRIGYGKGFYDRYLKNHRPKKAVGVIYPFQFINHIEISELDEKLDGYIKG